MIDQSLLQHAVQSHARRRPPGRMDGRVVREAMVPQLAQIAASMHQGGLEPTLAVILVGDDPASQIYVRHKIKLCQRVGVRSIKHELPQSISHQELMDHIRALNLAPQVHGVLVQMPLPPQIELEEVILAIHPRKDVDGFHPNNLGGLLMGKGVLEPCTPRGIMTLCRAYQVPLAGTEAVVVGRSMNVGRPMAQMLTRADATVTVCHRHTQDFESHVRRAGLLVVATGVPHLIPASWLPPKATVIDVGITRMPDGSLRGDVEPDDERPGLTTPAVPGGVGPMTVVTLIENTLRAAAMQAQDAS